ncbi:MAG TPA: hypothetical protein VIH57_02200 [Bacteroidales bacterium]
MKTLNYFVLSLFIILFSCVDKTNDNSGLSIGVNNSNVVINKLNPQKSIINPGSDSIDLNGDLHYDLVFIKSPEPLLTGFGIKTEMIKRSGIQVCLSKLNNYPDTLSYSTLLNNQMNWSDLTETKYILQSYDCHDGNNCFPIGNFLNLKERYLGLKIGNRFGWIKAVNEVFGPLKIEEYALMN